MRKLILCFTFIVAGAACVFAMPSIPYPGDSQIDVPVDVDLSWESNNVDGTFDLYFGTDISALLLVLDDEAYVGSGPTVYGDYDPGLLDLNTTYYWYIEDYVVGYGVELGPTWTFTTAASGPVTPAIPAPAAMLLGGIGTACVGFMKRKRSL